jgi:RNA polymerase sigma-70 factor (ECF subfamily)
MTHMALRRKNADWEGGGNSQFATTRWSIVLAAGKRSSPDANQALEVLCTTYWHLLYAYVRRRVTDIHEAHDLTQAFFAALLEKNYVGPPTAKRGRFPAYLLTMKSCGRSRRC